MPLYRWRVWTTHRTRYDQANMDGAWVESFLSEEGATRFATGGLIGPIRDTIGVERSWSLHSFIKSEVEPVQREPSGAAPDR